MRFELDALTMVGGTSKDIRLSLYTVTNRPFSLTDTVVYFALTDFTNPTSSPIFRTTCTVSDTGDDNVATVELVPANTKDLSGRFIYQFTVQRDSTERDVLQGMIDIFPNTDKESVT